MMNNNVNLLSQVCGQLEDSQCDDIQQQYSDGAPGVGDDVP